MNPSDGGKPEPPIEPEQLIRLLELELMQKRAARQAAGTRRSGLRAASFLFLFLVVLGAVLGGFFLFSSGKLEGVRTTGATESGPRATPSATASP